MSINAPIIYDRGFLPLRAAADWMDKMWNGLDWRRIEKTPRREYYCSIHDKPYAYGKEPFARTYQPQTITPEIQNIWKVVEFAAGVQFDVCFLNGYEDESDQLGWHADNSPEMDDARPIAIVSLGAEREIWFRENPPPRITRDVVEHPVKKLRLEYGSLCLMQPGMQDTHQHRIPKAGFKCGPRISLTFRGYVPPTA